MTKKARMKKKRRKEKKKGWGVEKKQSTVNIDIKVFHTH